MHIRVGFKITLDCDVRTPVVLALYPRPEEESRFITESTVRTDPETLPDVFFDEFGNRRSRLVVGPEPFTLTFDGIVRDSGRPDTILADARQHPVEDLPFEALRYLTASRYCELDLLIQDAWRLFGKTEPGWPRVQAICDFVHEHITFGYGFARPTKTANDAFREKQGVCRDFAHLAITFCRAMNIPARYVSGYLGDIGVPSAGPGDFCAWFEAYLDGQWRTFDPRNNVPRIGRVPMVHGRDAADVPMIASFGEVRLAHFEVLTDEVKPELVEPPLANRVPAPRFDPSCDEYEPLFGAIAPTPAVGSASQWPGRFSLSS